MPDEVQHKSKVIDNQDLKIERTGRFEWYGDGTIHFLPDPGDPKNDIDFWTVWTGRPTDKKSGVVGSLQVVSDDLIFEKIGPQRYIFRGIDIPMISLSLHNFVEDKSLKALDSASQNR